MVPVEFETCPLCNEKIYLWKHFLGCKYYEQKNNSTRKDIENLMRFLEIESPDGDILYTLL